MLTIQREGLAVPVTKQLCEYLVALLNPEHQGCQAITINFKDPDYSSELGGYHPVEIRLVKRDDYWFLSYITDFCFVGSGDFAELAKDVDFDFGQDCFQNQLGIYPLKSAAEFYPMWEANFLAYATELSVFEVTITTED